MIKLSGLKYFSSLLFFAAALAAGWWLWNDYMQTPWTRDGKVRAEVVNIAPEVSGRIVSLKVHDNQFVSRGAPLFHLDEQPFRIALLNAEAQLAKSQADLAKAQHEYQRRARLPRNVISAEDLDSAGMTVKSLQAAEKAAQAERDLAQWKLAQTTVVAPTDGWISNLLTREGNYATEGKPLFALVDSRSFYVMGYFEETKLHNIRIGAPASIQLYGDDRRLTGKVQSIGRAIFDQSVDSSSSLVPEVKPTIPWVRLAQRVPVRIRLTSVPPDMALVAGTTCSIGIGH